MPCPASPEPDGYHRFQLKPSGPAYTTTCLYCGEVRTERPFDAPTRTSDTTKQQRATAARNAAQRAKREG